MPEIKINLSPKKLPAVFVREMFGDLAIEVRKGDSAITEGRTITDDEGLALFLQLGQLLQDRGRIKGYGVHIDTPIGEQILRRAEEPTDG